ncbi:hypothetical protein DAERI_060134 [Deinococcus aerius]|uniref:Uncharacterized protein n=1 Tax=Deinococcus aerius TaxID=200253 RepID=A0A2I9CVB8_9DEIO|nr:hypothetical protein [Deinococcus aerius]GBF05874.1 hypothetical protein DAERI_060134 [Deinococcus aerius]
MLSIILTLFVLALGCFLIDAALQARKRIPAPAVGAGWRDGDLLAVRHSLVSRELNWTRTPEQLRDCARHRWDCGEHWEARVLLELAQVREIELRLHGEGVWDRRVAGRSVRARAQVRGVA